MVKKLAKSIASFIISVHYMIDPEAWILCLNSEVLVLVETTLLDLVCANDWLSLSEEEGDINAPPYSIMLKFCIESWARHYT